MEGLSTLSGTSFPNGLLNSAFTYLKTCFFQCSITIWIYEAIYHCLFVVIYGKFNTNQKLFFPYNFLSLQKQVIQVYQ